jgi:hypothetical protein
MNSIQRFSTHLQRCLPLILALILFMSLGLAPGSALAWDSKSWFNPTHPSHSYFTEWAIDQLDTSYSELKAYRQVIIDGANQEMHELPVSGEEHGINLEEARLRHKGTNEGTDDIQGWWSEALSSYQAGNKESAYFLVGIILHMVQDMGAPAHANHVYHQGTLKEFDNFEFLAASNWKPDFSQVKKTDPGYSNPWEYYSFSSSWTREDMPNYNDRDSYSKFWLTASDQEKRLLARRQARTCAVTEWTLRAAERKFLGQA